MNSNNPTVLVGPVIGKVDESSARIKSSLTSNFT